MNRTAKGMGLIFRVLIPLLAIICPYLSYSQNCDVCPGRNECSPCSGGLTSLKLRYDGTMPANILAQDQKGPLFSSTLNPGDVFLVDGSAPNGKFTGNVIDIQVNNILNASINASCAGAPPLIGNTYGQFTIVEGTSLNGGAICCAENLIEKTPPVIENCPANIVTNLTDNNCSMNVTWQLPVASDNCEILSFTSNYSSGDNFPIGDTEINYTAIDIFGNESTCSFVVSVVTNQAPRVTDCPQMIMIESDENGEAVVDWIPPQANGCGTITVTESHLPGSTFLIGVTPVVYTFTDEGGGTASCTFDVKVIGKDIPLEIEKALTPDGDGIHDIWIISNIEKYSSNTVTIVDRWGNTVFSIGGYDNITKVWKGHNTRGELVPTGTYFYTIQLTGLNGTRNIKGFIEVVR